jgi:hypothetical protein
VAALRPDGSCEKLHTTSFAPLAQLLTDKPWYRIRGNGNAVFFDGKSSLRTGTGTSSSLEDYAHFLGILHVFDTLSKRYAHYFYRFDAKPPFRVRQVAQRKIPLVDSSPDGLGQPFSFVNGLEVVGSGRSAKVLVTYGSGDRERLLVMGIRELDRDFFEECNVIDEDTCRSGLRKACHRRRS